MDVLMYFADIPQYTIQNYRIWTIFTSWFVNVSIINLLFGLLSWLPTAMKIETEVGTLKYALTFLLNTVIIQMVFVVFIFLVSYYSPMFYNYPSIGLWPFIMFEITIMCLSNPDGMMMLFLLPCPIQAKYYPYILVLFFTLLNQTISFDIIAGLIYGHLYFFFFKEKLNISARVVKKIEDGRIGLYLKKFKGILLIKAITQAQAEYCFQLVETSQLLPQAIIKIVHLHLKVSLHFKVEV